MFRREAFAVLVLAVGLAACGPSRPTLLLEIASPVGFPSLRILGKHYRPDGRVDLWSLDVDAGGGGDTVRAGIELPARGRYALHFVVRDSLDRVHTVTRCYVVEGDAVDRDVVLSLLPPELDEDGDTFPEDVEVYCALRRESGLECDPLCASEAFLALGDCNPGPVEPPPGCAAPGPDESFNPFAPDLCGSCYDEDCHGGDAPCVDADGDGYPEGVDCDDSNPDVHPGAEEICGNGIDDNCRIDLEGCDDGDLPCDRDGDGYFEILYPGCGDDCDDSNPDVHPGAEEICGNGIDDDCNGIVDDGCLPDDADLDGLTDDEDCNDCDSGIGLGFPERCGNGVDEDCDGEDLACDPFDADGDGFAAPPHGTDCDDTDPRVYPGAPERCGDGIAQGCTVDIPCQAVVDRDGDGFGEDVDCDDTNPDVHPWAEEVCDPEGVDENCDGRVNEVLDPEGRWGCVLSLELGFWIEVDHYSDPRHCGRCRNDCLASRTGATCEAGECDCGGLGSCAGELGGACCIGEGGAGYCADLTGSTRDCGACGRSCQPGESCVAPGRGQPGACICEAEGAPCPPGDCWHCCPGVGCVDVCSELDHCGSCGNDCDAGDHPAGDRCVDGRCLCGASLVACAGTEWCTELTEAAGARCGCADLDGDPRNCGACGRSCDDREPCTTDSCVGGRCVHRTRDDDGDGFCAAGCNDNTTGQRGDCRNGDCDDTNPAVNPGATEDCATPYDDNCDGSTNDVNAIGCTVFYRDSDGDGWGLSSDTRCLCRTASPYTATRGGDCNDSRAASYPGAPERCTGFDDDCDPATPDGTDECAGFCCGSPAACRACCQDSQCTGGDVCNVPSYTCGPPI